MSGIASENQEDLTVDVDGTTLPGSLSLPEAQVVGGLVPLHGAAFPQRDFFLNAHLAQALPNEGWAVLRYDRRPSRRMVPLRQQVEDAQAALRLLRSRAELDGLPVGLWGVSQGAWTAVLASAESDEIAFLVLVGFSGVSPGRQMGYATANFLRQAGYGSEEELAELAELRKLYEGYLRGDYGRASSQARIDELRDRPWFDLVYMPGDLPDRLSGDESGFIDFDPATAFAEVRCPVLLFFGEEDEEVPVDESIGLVEKAGKRASSPDVTIYRLEGVGHDLTRGNRHEVGDLHGDYESRLIGWLARETARHTA